MTVKKMMASVDIVVAVRGVEVEVGGAEGGEEHAVDQHHRRVATIIPPLRWTTPLPRSPPLSAMKTTSLTSTSTSTRTQRVQLGSTVHHLKLFFKLTPVMTGFPSLSPRMPTLKQSCQLMLLPPAVFEVTNAQPAQLAAPATSFTNTRGFCYSGMNFSSRMLALARTATLS